MRHEHAKKLLELYNNRFIDAPGSVKRSQNIDNTLTGPHFVKGLFCHGKRPKSLNANFYQGVTKPGQFGQ